MPDHSPSLVEIVDFISHAESQFPVQEWTIDGLAVWPIVRIHVAFSLIALVYAETDNQVSRNQEFWHRSRGIARSLAKLITARHRDSRHNARIRPADVAFLITASARFFKVEGEWYQPYSDSFIKYLNDYGLASLSLEVASDGEYRIPRYRKSFFIQHRIYLLALMAVLKSRFMAPGNERLEGFTEFLAQLKSRFGYEGFNLKSLRRRVSQVFLYRDLYRRYLLKIRPSVGINDGYYALEAMGFSLACRELNILSIEIQHGVQGKNHFAYRTWSKFPTQGYALLPNIFWCWNEEDCQNIREWTNRIRDYHWPVTGGNPCLQIFSKRGEDLLSSLSGSFGQDRAGTLHILFTLQSFYELPTFLIEAVRNSPSEWVWLFRVHPQYWETREVVRKTITEEGLTNCLIEEASDVPLGVLLQRVDVHVTEFSSSVLEAHSMGVYSVVINQKGADLYGEKIRQGIVLEAYDSKKLIESILVQSRKRLPTGQNGRQNSALFREAVERVIIANALPKQRMITESEDQPIERRGT